MRCLFCRMDSTASRSVEHIIPESLWNTRHILPRGVVCDACNNYFAREIEKPFLDSPAISRLRFLQAIPNKRGRVPSSNAILLPGVPVVLHRHAPAPHLISMDVPAEAFNHILSNRTNALLLPVDALPPNDRVVARFLAKMAVEAMAYKLREHREGMSYLVDEPQLDPLRNFVRRGVPQEWPYHARRIYDPDRPILDSDGRVEQTVHEFDFLVTKNQEWYFVFALFGLELTINLGGPEIDGYMAWLEENEGKSPLYSGKNGS
ncbi:HNH endonuclease [Variovorax sp. ZT4R33]|uniref:HNH endonuclease n=1 Tax=Variovorax sp. ZT4R33 TaxID=3443743 RepID=UPI003F4506C6